MNSAHALSPSPPVRKHKGRQRCVETQAAILTATIDLLKEQPMRDVTMEAIAKRAGVSKATIYKWWPNKGHVALDAFLSEMQSSVETPNTGSAQQDFIEQLRSLLRFFASPYGRIYAQFMTEGQSDPEFLGQFRERFMKKRRDEVRVMWQRGVDRGELRREVNGDIALDLIYGAIIFRLLTGHAPLNDAESEAIVAAAFRGLCN